MPPPDRWEKYSAIGKVIHATRIVCFKVPLKTALCNQLPEYLQFTPHKLIQLVSDLNYQLGLVVDLTFTTKYYNYQEIERQGLRYEKIFTEGHNVPNDDVVYRFFDLLEKFFEDNKDEKIIAGVHCTHGVNRTGYLVCRYMIERLAFDPEEAIKAFGEARGHPVERENYLEDLKTRSHNTSYKYAEREKLPMKKPQPKFGDRFHGAPSRDRQRAQHRYENQDRDTDHIQRSTRSRSSHVYRESENPFAPRQWKNTSQDYQGHNYNGVSYNHRQRDFSYREVHGRNHGYSHREDQRTYNHDTNHGFDRNHGYDRNQGYDRNNGYDRNHSDGHRDYRNSWYGRQHYGEKRWDSNHFENHNDYYRNRSHGYSNDMYRGRARGHRNFRNRHQNPGQSYSTRPHTHASDSVNQKSYSHQQINDGYNDCHRNQSND